jgi:hypothetical protein
VSQVSYRPPPNFRADRCFRSAERENSEGTIVNAISPANTTTSRVQGSLCRGKPYRYNARNRTNARSFCHLISKHRNCTVPITKLFCLCCLPNGRSMLPDDIRGCGSYVFAVGKSWSYEPLMNLRPFSPTVPTGTRKSRTMTVALRGWGACSQSTTEER